MISSYKIRNEWDLPTFKGFDKWPAEAIQKQESRCSATAFLIPDMLFGLFR
jgi:hypothetical protein